MTFKVGILGLHTVLPITISCPSYIPESHPGSEIPSLWKVILVLGKARSLRVPYLGYGRAESSGWFDVLQKTCMRCDIWAGVFSWWSCQSPVAHGHSLLNHLNSFCRRMFKINAKFDADSLLYSFSHFGLDGRTVHMLTQWRLPPPLTSTAKS